MTRSAKPQDLETNLCFQVLGFDIFLDQRAKPWLIEVNQSPSFCTDSPLDQEVKFGVLSDALKILNLSWRRKNKYLGVMRSEMTQRLQGGRRMTLEERESTRVKKLAFKDKYEYRNKGKYERIFPVPEETLEKSEIAREEQERYDFLIACSKEVWGEQMSGGGVCAKKKIDELEKKHGGYISLNASSPTKVPKEPKTVKKAVSMSVPQTDKSPMMSSNQTSRLSYLSSAVSPQKMQKKDLLQTTSNLNSQPVYKLKQVESHINIQDNLHE